MGEKERRLARFAKEGEQEANFNDRFQAYEDWKKAQGHGSEMEESVEKPEKKKPFTKIDLVFIGLGLLATLLYSRCSS